MLASCALVLIGIAGCSRNADRSPQRVETATSASDSQSLKVKSVRRNSLGKVVARDEGEQRFSTTALCVLSRNLVTEFSHDPVGGGLLAVQVRGVAPSLSMPLGGYVCSEVQLDKSGRVASLTDPIALELSPAITSCKVIVRLNQDSAFIDVRSDNTLERSKDQFCELQMVEGRELLTLTSVPRVRPSIAPAKPQ